MKCYLLIPDGDFEIQAALTVRDMLKRHEPQSKVYFFCPGRPGYYKKKGYPEIRVPQTVPLPWNRFPALSRWWVMKQVLQRRRGFREQIVVFQQRPAFLPWIYLFSKNKPVFVNTWLILEQRRVAFESLVLRFWGRVVLVNDRSLCLSLRSVNVPAYFMGNLPADILKPLDLTFLTGRKNAYTLVPRPAFFFQDLLFLLEIARRIEETDQGYFLLALPKGIKVSSFVHDIIDRGWLFQKSLEGDIIEGYIRQERFYVNLTRFLGEAIIQADRVFSTDPLLVIQAVGWGKKAFLVNQENLEESVRRLRDQVLFTESNRDLQNRFGKRGAAHRVSSYLLRGVVEDDRIPFLRKNSE